MRGCVLILSFSQEGGGDIYPDGSVIYPKSQLLQRGGFSLVQVKQEGELLRAMYGTVPSSHRITAADTEHIAIVQLLQHLSDPHLLSVFPDCLAVVTTYSSKVSHAFRADSTMAGYWRQIFSPKSHPFKAMGHVKAHRAIDEVSAEERPRVKANALADTYAKKGAAYGEASAGDIAVVNAAQRDWNQVAKVVVALLPLWPCARELYGKLVLANAGANRPCRAKIGRALGGGDRQHTYTWNGRVWVCTWCLRSKRKATARVDFDPCGTPPAAFLGLQQDPKGHHLWFTQSRRSGLFGVFCQNAGLVPSAGPPTLGKSVWGPLVLKERKTVSVGFAFAATLGSQGRFSLGLGLWGFQCPPTLRWAFFPSCRLKALLTVPFAR